MTTHDKSKEPWDAEAVYDEQLAPLMTQIIAICKEHQIPMVAQFQYANHAEAGPAFCTTTLPNDRACDQIRELSVRMAPRRAMAFAETHVTNPDGSKSITIRRIT